MNQKKNKRRLLSLIETKRLQLNDAYMQKDENTEYYKISLEMDDLIEQYIALDDSDTVADII